MDDDDYGTFLTGKHTDPLLVNSVDTSRKWLMVAILSLLSGINQGICYSYAPIASVVEDRWQQQLHSTELITVYFVAYIPCSFVGSWLMDKKGLRYGVLLGATLQAVGASLRYLATYCADRSTEVQLTLLGQIIASIAMPFMVNSPPVLSANWFPPSQRATSTSIAVNANSMGTAIIYLTAPYICLTIQDVPEWNLYVAIIATLSAILAYFLFQSFPGPHSHEIRDETESIISDVQLQEDYDWKQWGNAFLHRGFWHTVVGFSVAECIVNAMAALLGKFLSTEGFSKTEIGGIGAAFIAASLVGSQVLSRYVDQERNHTQALQACLVLSALSLTIFKVTLPIGNAWITLTTLMFVGCFLGPLQPIVLELGVECAFPTSEATVAALQQLCGNFLSAILVPLLSVLRRVFTDPVTGHVPLQYFYAAPEWIFVILLSSTFMVFCFFDGEYKRHHHEIMCSPRGTLGKAPSVLAVKVKEPPPTGISIQLGPSPPQVVKGVKDLNQTT